MKTYTLIIIALLAFTMLYSCKNEVIAPQNVAAISKKSDSTTATINSAPSNPVQPPPGPEGTQTLVAKWRIVKDSTASQFIGPVHTEVYVGTSDDYYDFRADGKCYKHENGVYDTIAYKIVTANSVIFGDPVAVIDASTGKTIYQEHSPTLIDPLTVHSAKIVFGGGGLPSGGFSYNAIYLAK